MENLAIQKDSEYKLQPVILSGGTGSRLWPLSRQSFPKQYLKLDQKSQFSLLQNTYLRLGNLKNIEDPIIICNEEQRFIVAEQMREIDIKPKSIILEPFGKNTAPAITLGTLIAKQHLQDALILILSSDHLIEDKKKFQEIILQGIPHAENGRIVTFGVVPTSPETGYGYIESNEELSKESNFSKINKFIEKPSFDDAKKLIQNAKYSWNSGIFLFKASTIISELQKFQPKILEICKKSINDAQIDLSFTRINRNYFSECPNLPIDIAVMEKTELGTVLRFKAGWEDLGSWEAVWKSAEKDKDGNSKIGNSILKSSQNCYLRGDKRLVVGLGLKNIIVIDTNDAILVANKSHSQEVKEIVKDLEKNNQSEGKIHTKVYRPWGHYTSVVDGSTWQVKRLVVNPGASLSLQMHHHRSEHWVVVNGTAKIEINNKISLLNENQSIYVPLGSKHRLSNPGKIELILIEVQSGTYLGEDDIMRFDDKYGRDLNN